MRHDGFRIFVEDELGETRDIVLAALGVAAFRLAPAATEEAVPGETLDPDTVRCYILETPRGPELVMTVVRGRSCMTHVAPHPEDPAVLLLNPDVFEGSLEDLMELAAAFVGAERRPLLR